MTVEDCLPPELKGPATVITRMAAGLSGAGVYRVDSAGQSFVLKVAADTEHDADWGRVLPIQRLAAEAGLAPRIVHVDEDRRAVVTAFVADRSFSALLRDPRTRQAALTLLGQTVRRIHALAVPAGAPSRDPRAFLARLAGGLPANAPLPGFARDAVERALAEEPPPSDRAPVLGHNDLNPSNLIYDGEALLVLDWALAGLADPLYDLAVLAVFFRMDEATSLQLLAAHDGAPRTVLPGRFLYLRRLVAARAGPPPLSFARELDDAGATATQTLATTLSLGEFYQRMATGALKLGTPRGQWAFGLALLKESLAL
jgi:aminoglycoside phosphotransferase (APT) family kinase protein